MGNLQKYIFTNNKKQMPAKYRTLRFDVILNGIQTIFISVADSPAGPACTKCQTDKWPNGYKSSDVEFFQRSLRESVTPGA